VISTEGVQPVMRMRGTMLWFNAAKDLGALQTEDGERIDVSGASFSAGQKPLGRCAGMAVQFERVEEAVTAVTFVSSPMGGRARLRHRA
jgi:cold shock CspA family protein